MTIDQIIDWVQSHVELVITVGSAMLAMLGAFAAARETRKQRRVQLESLRERIDAASLVWGQDAIDLMTLASGLAVSGPNQPPATFDVAKLDVSRRLSAQVDKGRMFFPNVDPDGKGAEKAGAYRGSRPPILDALVYAYYEVRALGTGNVTPDDSAGYIDQCRRLLVSELQAHLDPRRRDEIVDRYNDQKSDQRGDALSRAGKLGIMLDARRPGTLSANKETGWTDRIGQDERKTILADIHAAARTGETVT